MRPTGRRTKGSEGLFHKPLNPKNRNYLFMTLREALCIVLLVVILQVSLGLLLNYNFTPTNGVVGGSGAENILEFHSNGKIYRGHPLTSNEIAEAKGKLGVRDPTENYSKIVDGHGTGLAPPTEEEWESMVGATFVDSVSVSASSESEAAGTSKRLDLEPYFPPVGNQGAQGSCTAWATGYYNNGYLQAKIHGWTNPGGINRIL
jgi:hypothetical protein